MNNLEKYTNTFKTAFSLVNNDAITTAVMNDTQNWDSVGHMELITQLEDVFDIMFDADDILEFTSYQKGIEILKKYNIEI